jgi:hypothetical protein
MEPVTTQETAKFNFPTETIELPSKGLLYPADSPLASGRIEMKYMTAKEEDILTNQNYIKQGTVIDKLLQSMIISKINYDDLLICDKDAVMIASRILGYGKDYKFKYAPNSTGISEDVIVDLTTLEEKHLDESLIKTPSTNEFSFTLPHTKNQITFKLLTHGDEKKIDQDLQGLKKIDPKANPEVSTRWKHIITSVNGDKSLKTIREFVDNYLLAKDSRALREHISSIIPGIKLEFTYVSEDYVEEGVNIPIGISFFWPDSGI